MKRITEVKLLEVSDEISVSGRGYRREDLAALIPLAASTGIVSALVFGLYINSNQVQILYSTPQALWGVVIVLCAWISRIIIISGRGHMDDDPIVFTFRDRMSLACAFVSAVILLLARI